MSDGPFEPEPSTNKIGDLLTDLAACLCAVLTPDGEDGPGLCFCGVVGGSDVLIDVGFECDRKCGMAWVRLDSAYPAVTPGQQSLDENSCGTLLGLDIELGVARCVDMGDDEHGPDPESIQSSALQMAEDVLSIRRAIACCEALEDVDYVLGSYTPQGPLGNAAGGTWTLSVVIY